MQHSMHTPVKLGSFVFAYGKPREAERLHWLLDSHKRQDTVHGSEGLENPGIAPTADLALILQPHHAKLPEFWSDEFDDLRAAAINAFKQLHTAGLRVPKEVFTALAGRSADHLRCETMSSREDAASGIKTFEELSRSTSRMVRRKPNGTLHCR